MDLDTLALGIAPDMYFRQAAIGQIRRFRELAELLGLPVMVLDTHRSKSIDLPVVTFETARADAYVTVLDNFHEVDVHYRGHTAAPVSLTPEECHYQKLDGAAYLEEIAKCEGYSWRGWTPEEILDQRILRVQVTNEGGGTWWNDARSWARKERWINRFTSAEWYSKDWSGGELIGDVAAVLADESKYLLRASSCFVNHTGPYREGATQFSLVFETGTVVELAPLIRKLLRLEAT